MKPIIPRKINHGNVVTKALARPNPMQILRDAYPHIPQESLEQIYNKAGNKLKKCNLLM